MCTIQLQNFKDDHHLKELMNSEEYDFRYDLGISQLADSIHRGDKEKIVVLMTKHFIYT